MITYLLIWCLIGIIIRIILDRMDIVNALIKHAEDKLEMSFVLYNRDSLRKKFSIHFTIICIILGPLSLIILINEIRIKRKESREEL